MYVCPDYRTALTYAQHADRVMTGRIGAMGSAAREWQYAGRAHVFLATEPEIHTTRSPRSRSHRSLRRYASS